MQAHNNIILLFQVKFLSTHSIMAHKKGEKLISTHYIDRQKGTYQSTKTSLCLLSNIKQSFV